MTLHLHLHAKVLLHVWSYEFYDIMLSTEELQHHVINRFIIFLWIKILKK